MSILHRSDHTLNALLPAYLNHTLSVSEQRSVEEWLRRDPQARAELAAWQQLRARVIDQPHGAPSAVSKRKLMARLQTAPKPSVATRWLPWTSGLVLAALVLMMLWLTIQPGIGLQWSVADGDVSSFRIYRAASGSNDFTVVREIPAQPGIHDYTYIDTSLSLNPDYVYRVEGRQGELAASSPMITASAQEVMRNQLIILSISLIAGLSGVLLGQYWLEIRSSHALHRMAS
jgi:hypothetical protein